MMNIKIKTLAVPAFVALSLAVTACAGGGNQTIEAPDAVDGAVQEGIEGVEQGADQTGDAVKGGFDTLKKGAEDATGAVQDGAKNLEQGAKDTAGSAKEQVEETIENVDEAINGAGDKSE